MRLSRGRQAVEVDEIRDPEIAILGGPSATRINSSQRGNHLLEALDEPGPWIDLWHELRELCNRHAIVGHALKMQIDVRIAHQAKVARTGVCRASNDNAFLNRDVASVHVIVEGDDLIRKLMIALVERVDSSSERAQHERSLFLQR